MEDAIVNGCAAVLRDSASRGQRMTAINHTCSQPMMTTTPTRPATPTNKTTMKQTQTDIDHNDDSSLESESSAAVVSLYNSWSGTSDAESFVTEDDLSDLSPPTAEELLEQLQKRCRPQDIPATPVFRPRARPVCLFINFMGQRQQHVDSSSSTASVPSPVDCKSDLHFDDGDDYLDMIESQSTVLVDHDFDEADDLFDCIVQVAKKARYDDESPLSPVSINEDDFLSL